MANFNLKLDQMKKETARNVLTHCGPFLQITSNNTLKEYSTSKRSNFYLTDS